mmetsp:Transcript_43089/g.82194  ORF Transcript_43089/g.82194 Transcript_43089/m.82194 type:complete len:93 (+) Transcript_43089:959-1237(+)
MAGGNVQTQNDVLAQHMTQANGKTGQAPSPQTPQAALAVCAALLPPTPAHMLGHQSSQLLTATLSLSSATRLGSVQKWCTINKKHRPPEKTL